MVDELLLKTLSGFPGKKEFERIFSGFANFGYGMLEHGQFEGMFMNVLLPCGSTRLETMTSQ